MRGRRYCRVHGGLIPNRENHYNFKDGRRIKFSGLFPKRLKQAISNAVETNAGVDLQAELIYLDTREAELIASLSNRDSRETIKAIAKQFQVVQRACQIQSWDEMNEAMRALEHTIQAGARDDGTWIKLQKVIQDRVKVAREIHKQKVDDASMLHAAVVMDLNLKTANILRSAVEMNVSARFNSLLADIRVSLAQSNLPNDSIETITDIITPLITEAAEKTEDAILTDAYNGIDVLIPKEYLLP